MGSAPHKYWINIGLFVKKTLELVASLKDHGLWSRVS